MELLIKGLLSAAVVASLLWLAQRWSSRVAGLLTGLPVVSGPAMLWLAIDNGTAYAQEVCLGAVASGAVCALFALCYAMALRHVAKGATLALGSLGAALPLLVMAAASNELPIGLSLLMMVATAICVSCLSALSWTINRATPGAFYPPRAPVPLANAAAVRTPVTWTPRRTISPGRVSGAWLTPFAAGLVSIITGALAGELGAFWSGVLSSMPWVCAAVALQLQRQAGHDKVMSFLHGYTAGLIGRCVFVAVLGAYAQAWGVVPALLCAAAATTLSALCTARWWPLHASRRQLRRQADVPGCHRSPVANHTADFRPYR
jgi:hypothetical protein